MAIDQLVEQISTYRRKPLFLHTFVVPFLAIQAIWFAYWWQNLGIEEHWELGCIVAVGIFILQALTALFCYWFVEVDALLNCIRISDPKNAQMAKVKPTPNNGWTEFVPLNRIRLPNGNIRISFCFQKIQYIYNDEQKEFHSVLFDTNLPFRIFQEAKGIENEEKAKEIQLEYGDNRVEMEVPKFGELFIERATAPFFVFQVFCVGLWCLEDMWYYSLLTLFMLVTFEATIVKQQMRNMSEIRNMGSKPHQINVYRAKRWNKINSDQLICGDIVSINSTKGGNDDKTIPCDLLLLRGHAICDEAMLTGESIPQMKEPVEELEKERHFDIGGDGRLHVLFGGTKMLQHTPPAKNEAGMKAPDNGVICYVLRTGFNTQQGSLLRTIMFGVKRVSANNLETFAFILFLLIFAIAAAAYLWMKGTEDESRSRYKLFLECVLILTSVIPPELPIELSLAVNNSLIALQKLGIFCTEPFRIPFAGKVDICCFDKTGTLTKDELVMEGIAGLTQNEQNQINNDEMDGQNDQIPKMIYSSADCGQNTIRALASCHSLVRFDEELVGDPLEKAILKWIDWNVTKQDAVVPCKKNTKIPPLKILRRFHFSSQMKRMTVIAGYQQNASESKCVVTVKGAPEILREMFHELPTDYEENYQKLAQAGARIIALGIREIDQLSSQQLREMKREEFERDLEFAGFSVISCPLKVDSRQMIAEITEASHRVVMITGDNVLTAIHVAKVLKFIRKNRTALILDQPTVNDEMNNAKWLWRSVDGQIALTTDVLLTKNHLLARSHKFELCITGNAFEYLLEELEMWKFKIVLCNVRVYARMSPKQKERAINALKGMGFVTLMCGDGTNDVGALKHAEVGVALLTNPMKETSKEEEKQLNEETSGTNVGSSTANEPTKQSVTKKPPNLPSNAVPRTEAKGRIGGRQQQMQNRLDQMMREMEQEEQLKVRLGDASYAAPFTSKSTSIQSICNIIKQGRCTLVTTLQMFKILALNALVLAYSQSVLYLDGVKFSDTQATIQGIFLAACFLFISRSKPLKTLAKQRPIPNIFNLYTLSTITTQFLVHFLCLLHIVQLAHNLEERKEKVELEKEFKPNLLNTAVYLMSSSLQIATFAVNYRGRPFMESLTENRPLFYSIISSFLVMVAFASNTFPEMNAKFELVHIPESLRNTLVLCIIGDLFCCFIIDRLLNFLFGDARPK